MSAGIFAREVVLAVVEEARGVRQLVRAARVDGVHLDAPLVVEAGVEELHLEGQLLGTPEGPVGPEADVAPLVVGERADAHPVRHLPLAIPVRLLRHLLGEGRHVVEIEGEGRRDGRSDSSAEEEPGAGAARGSRRSPFARAGSRGSSRHIRRGWGASTGGGVVSPRAPPLGRTPLLGAPSPPSAAAPLVSASVAAALAVRRRARAPFSARPRSEPEGVLDRARLEPAVHEAILGRTGYRSPGRSAPRAWSRGAPRSSRRSRPGSDSRASASRRSSRSDCPTACSRSSREPARNSRKSGDWLKRHPRPRAFARRCAEEAIGCRRGRRKCSWSGAFE